MEYNHRLSLVEDYEDAWFALLMDEVALSEGEKAFHLNKLLQQDPSAAFSPELLRRCQKTIRDAFFRRQVKQGVRSTRRLLRIAVIAALVGILLFTSALAISPSLRRDTLNVIVELFDEYSVLRFDESRAASTAPADDDDVIYHYGIGVSWLPEGYELSGGWSYDSGNYVEYCNNKDGKIEIWSLAAGHKKQFHFDTEESSQYTIIIQDSPCSLFTHQNGTLSATWLDAESQRAFYVSSTALTYESFLNMANKIIFKL